MDADRIIIALVIAGLFLIGRFGIGLLQGLGDRRRASDAAREQIRQTIEQRMAELLAEFPQMSDEEIALLMRDELENERCAEPMFFHFATPHTAGRIRRTAIVIATRELREKQD